MTEFNILERKLSDYWALYLNGTLSKGDIVGIFLILYDPLFPVSDWLQYSPHRKLTSLDLQSFFYPKQNPDFKDHPFLKKNTPEQSLGYIFNKSQLKKETLRSSKGLMHVYTHPQTIHILDYIPTPMQVLEMQAAGFRCVTLLRSASWFRHTFDHKRNIRDFVIHDLEHIWQLFENPQLTGAQIQFSQKLLDLTRRGHFEFLLNDADFSGDFNYIISDMNTHPAHTYATLKSLITRKKIKTLPMGVSRYNPVTEAEISLIMQHFDGLVESVLSTESTPVRVSDAGLTF